MWWQSDVEKNSQEIEYLKLDFLCSLGPFFFFVLLWDPFFFVHGFFFMLGFFFVFFRGFLSSSCSFFNFFRSLLCTFYSHVNCSSSSSVGSSLHLLSSSISSNLHYVLQILLFKTRVPFGKKISMSAIKTWGFKARFLHWTRASKARDVTLLNSF